MGYLIQALDDNNIPYIVIKKPLKRLILKYNQKSILEIHQPINFPDIEVIKFVEKHLDWVLVHKPVRILPHESYQTGDIYLLLGKEYFLDVAYSNHETVIVNNNKIIVYTKDGKNIEDLLNKFRYEQADIVFNEILYRSFKSMEKELVKYPELKVKPSKTKWGCCYINKNLIMLNIALIHVPFDLIEYVIFHELCHFVYSNHSKEFHQLLQKYVYDERKKRRRLVNYSIIYK